MNDESGTHAEQQGRDSERAAAREALVAGLRNAHALEKQGLAVFEAQLGSIDGYPDLKSRLTEHLRASREHVRRLEGALEDCGAAPSMMKDAFMSFMGMSQASVQGFADDAVLKALLADIMLENLEIASYRSLLELADMAQMPQVAERLRGSLDEEIEMANWLQESLPAITRRYVQQTAREMDAEAAGDAPDMNATPWYAKEPKFGGGAASTGVDQDHDKDRAGQEERRQV